VSRRRKHAAHENHERWLVSYADFITLLFAFFVVMFATSQTDKGKTAQLSESMRKALNEDQIVTAIAGILGGVVDDKGKGNAQMRGPGGASKLTSDDRKEGRYAELLPAMNYLNRELEEEIRQGKMQVSMQARGLVVSLQQTAFFPSGDDAIPEQTYQSVAKVAEVVNGVPNPVRLEGHTDSVPLNPDARFRTNWELSAARAIAMMELLVSCCAVDRERFSISGYADNAPVADNDTADGRGRNRRVDIVILNQAGGSMEPGR
jgi:chemotaxis protein MotB